MRARVYWLIRYATQLPGGEDWLGPGERARLRQLRATARRRDWLLGRWTAKQALLRYPELGTDGAACPYELEVAADPTGAPRVLLRGMPLPVAASLSHRGGAALCALALGSGVGCDLESIDRRSAAFLEESLTAAERARVAASAPRDLVCNALWSAKESVTKLAFRTWRPSSPRAIDVELSSAGATVHGWQPYTARRVGEETAVAGWWRRLGGWVLTVATDRPALRPIALDLDTAVPREVLRGAMSGVRQASTGGDKVSAS